VKYPSREMAEAAISGLNGTYMMRVNIFFFQIGHFWYEHFGIFDKCEVHVSAIMYLIFFRVAISLWLYDLPSLRDLKVETQGLVMPSHCPLILYFTSVSVFLLEFHDNFWRGLYPEMFLHLEVQAMVQNCRGHLDQGELEKLSIRHVGDFEVVLEYLKWYIFLFI
jgi:hypothetical protein